MQYPLRMSLANDIDYRICIELRYSLHVSETYFSRLLESGKIPPAVYAIIMDDIKKKIADRIKDHKNKYRINMYKEYLEKRHNMTPTTAVIQAALAAAIIINDQTARSNLHNATVSN